MGELCDKGLARITELGQVVRVTSDETYVKRVRQMPEVVRSQQPTIAIITAQFCEKLAVDAMIENKDTYVRYKGEGEWWTPFRPTPVDSLVVQANRTSTPWATSGRTEWWPPNCRPLGTLVRR